MNKFKTGFTLAEILITLSIIGVIASMTIPSLVQDVQDAQLKTAWKKNYADLNQAAARLISDYSGDLKGLCPDGDKNCLRDKFTLYLNYTKVCDATYTLGNCWNNNGANQLNGTPYLTPGWWNGFAGLVLNNGSFLIFELDSSNCQKSTGNLFRCGWLTSDVNGFKGPNTVGKDIFRIWLFKDSLKPFGIPEDGRTDNCDNLSTGDVCAAKYLYQ